MIEFVKSLPALAFLKPWSKTSRYASKSIKRLFGASYPRTCTVCSHKGRFFSYGYPLTADVICPSCLSLERHRALAIYDQRNNLFRGKDILHFAPEPFLSALIRGRGVKSYMTCDLYAKNVDRRFDVQSIDLPDQSFDLVICLHVLEHVSDDHKAMTELRRVLRPTGQAVLMVPIEEGLEETYENSAIVTREDRLIHFGQEDHVRFYGRDFRDRLREAGFSVSEWTSREPDVFRHGLRRGEKIFLCMPVR